MNKKLSVAILSVALIAFAAIGIMAASSTNTVFADREKGQCNKEFNGFFADIGVHGPSINDLRKSFC